MSEAHVKGKLNDYTATKSDGIRPSQDMGSFNSELKAALALLLSFS